MLGTIRRAGEVLDLFTPESQTWGATAVAAELGISKSQSHDLLVSLAAIGLLRRRRGGRYELGWRIVSLSAALARSSDLQVQAGRIMRRLVTKYGETVHLAVWDRGSVVYLIKIEGTNSVRIASSAVGSRLPGHCSGVGKVLMSAITTGEVDDLVQRDGLARFTANTIVDRGALQRELDAIRERGYAIDNQEVVAEVCCVAAPVYDATGDVVAALSMSVPSYRWERHRSSYISVVPAAAEQVSKRLRHLGYMRELGQVAPSLVSEAV